MIQRFTKRTRIDAPAQDVFDWHKRDGALQRLIPPWLKAQVLDRSGDIGDGDRVAVRMSVCGLTLTWLVEHRDYIEGRRFRDLQLKGPFARWEHTHRFEPIDDAACLMIDEVEYELPLGGLGDAIGRRQVRDQLERAFVYRHRLIADVVAHELTPTRPAPATFAVSGATGLVGSALTPVLSTQGQRVRRIVRGEAVGPDRIGWEPIEQRIDAAGLDGVDVVVHLAGENIMGRWTPAKKQRIGDSRVLGARGVATALAAMERKPAALLCASAVGWYGSRGDEVLTEDSGPGEGFLAQVCRQWEQATQPAADAGIRVVNLRIGAVLSPRGGALAKMLPIFKAGLGGPIGGGEGWMPWIALDDLVDVIVAAAFNDHLRGPVNATAPNPVTMRQFAKTLADVLHRPAIVAVPATAVRWTLGELADQVMLASLRVSPLRLAQAGHRFRHSELEPALRTMLGRWGDEPAAANAAAG